MNLTPAQAMKFWRLFARASAAAGIESRNLDAWRHELTLQATGKQSIREINNGRDYEELMLALAQHTQDDGEIGYWSGALERRARWHIGEVLRQLSEIEGEPYEWNYARAIYRQSDLPLAIESTPAFHLWKVLDMLDTARRRSLKAAGWRSGMKYNPSLHYRRHPAGNVTVLRPGDHADQVA